MPSPATDNPCGFLTQKHGTSEMHKEDSGMKMGEAMGRRLASGSMGLSTQTARGSWRAYAMCLAIPQKASSAKQNAVPSRAMSQATQLMQAMGDGDPHAAAKLLPLVYEELQRIA